MKKQLKIKLTWILLLISCMGIGAQDSLIIRMSSEAQLLFIQKDYARALPLYQELLKSFPKEPVYQFGAGVCLVNLNNNPEEAIRLLRPLPVSSYNPMAFYYLGRSLHTYYSFEDAIKAYSKFILNGKSSDVKALNMERLIEMAKNGLKQTQVGRNIKVQSVKPIQLAQLPQVAEINGTGKLIRKPAEFCSKNDLKVGFHPWMFLPLYTEINEYVYVAGYDQGEKNGKQLFRLKNINHEIWSAPEPLDATINTPYDEEFPFFDIKTSTLYFSSTGHSSMGGYDIFKSTYNWNTKTWSQPENMGFPINSPYDDYAFITDEYSRMASFISTRNTGPDQVMIYRIKMELDTSGIHFESVDDIRQASKLIIEPANKIAFQEQEIQELQNLDPQVIKDSADQIPVIIPINKDYHKVLADALLLQIRADSLSRITRDLRIQAKEIPDEAVKKQLIADIIKADKAAKNLQREADQKFTEARELKADNEEPGLQEEPVVKTNKEINGISVYQYRSEIPEMIPDDLEDALVSEIPASNDKDSIEINTNDFTLLEKSPYNESNPIPQGLAICPGLIYRIQLGVFSKEKPYDAFGGMRPVVFELTVGGNMYKYFTGLFSRINTVSTALEKVRSNGFPDAFIVAFFDGKSITTEKAREIEFSGFKMEVN
jgi:tetratricopeptide (TPR) repeat protein